MTQPLSQIFKRFQIVGFQGFCGFNQLADKLRLIKLLVKKFFGRDIKILTNIKKFRKREQRSSRGDTLNIAPAVTKIKAHLVFRHTLLDSQLRNPLSYELFVHIYHPNIEYTNLSGITNAK